MSNSQLRLAASKAPTFAPNSSETQRQIMFEATAKQALDFAMPEGQQHSHSLEIKPEREINIPGYRFGMEM